MRFGEYSLGVTVGSASSHAPHIWGHGSCALQSRQAGNGAELSPQANISTGCRNRMVSALTYGKNGYSMLEATHRAHRQVRKMFVVCVLFVMLSLMAPQSGA